MSIGKMQQEKEKKDEMALCWNAFLAGDDAAFAKIYETHAGDLLSFGTTLTTNSELVKDCIQDIFFGIYQKKAKLSPVDNVKAYLLVAFKNALTNATKRQKVHQKIILSYDVAEEPTDQSEEERMIEREYELAMQQTTAKHLSALTERQREVIRYRYMDELSLEEISKLLDINYHSVANIIQRALKKMRNLYLTIE